jgi:hypothetical protein
MDLLDEQSGCFRIVGGGASNLRRQRKEQIRGLNLIMQKTMGLCSQPVRLWEKSEVAHDSLSSSLLAYPDLIWFRIICP